MPQVINTNVSSITAQRMLDQSQGGVNTSLQRLSSGLRINSAKDDAAGLAISERMQSQINGLNQAVRNANDAVSLTQTAEGALAETTNLLQRVRELAVQSANATNSSTDRAALASEVTQLVNEIDRIATTTEFNGMKLLNGTFSTKNFQVGANANQTVGVTIASAKKTDLGAIFNVDPDKTKFEAAMLSTKAATDAGSKVASQTLSFTVGGGSVQNVSIATDSSAATIASQISANVDGLSATAATKIRLSGIANGAQNELVDLKVDGVLLTDIVVGANVASTLDAIAAKIQANSDLSHLTVTDNATSLDIANTTGADIKFGINGMTESNGTTAADIDIVVDVFRADGAVSGTSQTLDGSAATTGEHVTATGAVQFTTTKAAGTSFTFDSDVALGSGGLGTVEATAAAVASTDSVNTIDISTATGAQTAINIVDSALNTVNTQRASLGALQNRFESIVTTVATGAENQAAARSRIVDADFAAETAALTKGQILQQAGIAVLAQANAAPQNVLSLLQ